MIRYGITLVLLLSASLLHAQVGNTGFYLLRTGYVLEGSATIDGRHYIVQTPFGTMNVPVHSVEYVGKSRADVYQHKRNGVDSADYNALVRLAEWCISNGFIEEGIDEYNRAGLVAPNAVFAGITQQRLETLRQMVKTGPVREVPIPQADIPAGPSVSRQALESFVRRVQPVLVNRCIAADCHGTHGEQPFKLGIPQESMGSTSRRNLQAVLSYINRDDPMASILLSALVTPHGGARTALTVDSNPYVQVAQWIQQVARELPAEQRTESTTTPIRPVLSAEQFRQTESGGTTQQRRLDPLDPDVFNERYHRRTR